MKTFVSHYAVPVLRRLRNIEKMAAVALTLLIFLGVSALRSAAAAPSASPGTVKIWGGNYSGQLGNGTTTDSLTAVEVNNLTSVLAISSGANHSLALKSDGTVWGWGYNVVGQLGNGTMTNSSTPVQMGALRGISAISGGDYHSLALTSNGTVWACGYNNYGQLGNGTTTNSSFPVQVGGLSGVVAVKGGGYHSMVLKSDGTVWTWGSNFDGQLGNGTTDDSSMPVQVSGLTGVVAIAAGRWHSLALKSDGTVTAWGLNYYGQLGNGSTTNSSTPMPVSTLTDVAAIAGGAFHSMALKTDGTAWTWGENIFGQLGNGNTANRLTPVQVSNLSGAKTISGGAFHSLAIKSDGTVTTWGFNTYGQLGNGNNLNSPTPVLINGLTEVVAIAGGASHSLAIVSSHTLDADAPTTTARVSPLPGLAGWNNNDVTVALSASDNQDGSGVKEITWFASGTETIATTIVDGASASIPINTEGRTLITFHATDNAGNSEAEETVTVKLDKTLPSLSMSRIPAPNSYGWNNTEVVVNFTCADDLSGVASCSSPMSLTAEGPNQSVTGSTSDNAGNSASLTVSGINIDKAPPVVSFSGNAGSYPLDQMVNITCSATDNLSGLLSSTCKNITGPAFTFPPGINTFKVSATDKAGNVSQSSTTFTVTSSFDSLCILTHQWISKAGVANSLCAKLDAAEAAAARGNLNAKAGSLGAYINEVLAQGGKSLTVEQATLLAQLASGL